MTSELHELLAGDRRDGGESTRNDYPNPYFASYDVKLHGLTSTQVVIPAGEDRDVSGRCWYAAFKAIVRTVVVGRWW